MTGERNSIDSSRWPEGVSVASVGIDDVSLALDVLETAFPELSRTFFYNLITRDPSYKSGYSLAVRKKRRILSFARIFQRVMDLCEESIELGGIGCVATRPDCRRKGYASALLERACGILQNEGVTGSLLFTKIQPFYERLGWTILRQNEQEISVDRLQQVPFCPLWIRSLRDRDYPTLQTIYSRMQERMGGGILRTEIYWRARAAWLTHFPVIVLDEGEILGYFYYAQYDLLQPVMSVSEYGYLNRDEKNVERLLRAMIRKAEELRCDSIRGFFKHDTFVRSYCETHNLFTGEHGFHYVMWKDLVGKPRLNDFQKQIENHRLILWTTDGF